MWELVNFATRNIFALWGFWGSLANSTLSYANAIPALCVKLRHERGVNVLMPNYAFDTPRTKILLLSYFSTNKTTNKTYTKPYGLNAVLYVHFLKTPMCLFKMIAPALSQDPPPFALPSPHNFDGPNSILSSKCKSSFSPRLDFFAVVVGLRCVSIWY